MENIKLVYTVKRRRESDTLARFTAEFTIQEPADFGKMLERMRVFIFAQYPHALWLETEDGILVLTEE